MIAPGFEQKVMHSSLRIGDDVMMCSDGSKEQEKSRNVFLSLNSAPVASSSASQPWRLPSSSTTSHAAVSIALTRTPSLGQR
jgi:uncharacterized glyoxalase superfamily protein PhnB